MRARRVDNCCFFARSSTTAEPRKGSPPTRALSDKKLPCLRHCTPRRFQKRVRSQQKRDSMQAALLLLCVAAAATLLLRSKLLLLDPRLVFRRRSARKQYESSPIPGLPAAGSLLSGSSCCMRLGSSSGTPGPRRRSAQWLPSCCLRTSASSSVHAPNAH